jgi:GH24 family phage-related lysozyme (muramidase)
MKLPNIDLKWPIAWNAVQEIARSEGCRLSAYRCSAGVPTLGWGETRGVKMGDTITQAEADRRFCESLTEFTEGVKAMLTRDASANELGALVSLAYNIGLAGFKRSTVLREHNAGNFQSAARAFALWNQAGGQVLAGLTARRAREAALYLTPDDGIERTPMAQQIEPESSLSSSPIAQSGMISIIGGVAAAMSAVVQPVKEFADGLGIEPGLVIGIIAVIVGFIVIEQRKKQRKEGWA